MADTILSANPPARAKRDHGKPLARRDLVRRIGRGLCCGGLLIGLVAMLATLEPFYFGLWPQAEPMALATHVATLVCACGVACLAWVEPRRLKAFARHPFVMFPFALSGLTVALAPFVQAPGLSLYGHPALGAGGISYFCLAIMILAAMMLRRHADCRRILAITSVTALAVIAALLLIFGKGSTWAPFWFSDYLAFPALFLAPLLLGGRSIPSYRPALASVALLSASPLLFKLLPGGAEPTIRAVGCLVFLIPPIVFAPRGDRIAIATALAFALAAALVLLSDNVTAIAAIILVALFLPLLWRAKKIAHGHAPELLAITIVCVPFIVTASNYVLAEFSTQGSFVASGPDLPVSVTQLLDTLWDRARLLDLYANSVADNPAVLVTGHGWGSQTDLLAGGLLLDGIELVPSAGQGTVNANWIAIHWLHWHSHNIFLEALLAIGFVGLALLLAWVASFATHSRRLLGWLGPGIGMAYAIVGSMWFELPGVAAYTAIGLAFLAGGRGRGFAFLRSPGVAKRGQNQWSLRLLPICGAALLAGIILVEVTQARKHTRWLGIAENPTATAGKIWGPTAPADQDCDRLANDWGRGGHHLTALYSVAVTALKQRLREDPRPMDTDVALLQRMACASDKWPGSGGVRLGTWTVLAMAELAFPLMDGRQIPEFDPLLRGWEPRLRALLDRAPGRFDLVAPYYQWRLGRGQEAELLEFARILLKSNPVDPVALWFSGIVLLGDPEHALDGARRMKQALALGVHRLTPISPAIREQVEGFLTEN